MAFSNESGEVTWLSYIPNVVYDGTNSEEITNNKMTVYIASVFITAESLTTVGYGTADYFTLREQLFAMILLFFGIIIIILMRLAFIFGSEIIWIIIWNDNNGNTNGADQDIAVEANNNNNFLKEKKWKNWKIEKFG